MKRLLVALLIAAPLAAFAQYEPVAPMGDAGTRRSPWYIGFGLGAGNGRLSFASGDYTFQEEHDFLWGTSTSPTTVSVNLKVGATLTPRLLLGFDLTAVRSQYDSGGSSTGIQITNYDAVATWFPRGEGFFLRGGAGLSSIVENVDTPISSDSASASGVNVILGAGYALWLGQSFNLTLNADYSLQSYGASDTNPESSSFWALWVGFDWY